MNLNATNSVAFIQAEQWNIVLFDWTRPMSVFGLRLKAARLEARLSQEQLGLAAELDRTFISQVERARINVSIDNIEKLAVTLDVDAALLFVHPSSQ